MDALSGLRSQHEAGVLTYFLRRTGSVDLTWELAGETWATAELAARRVRRPTSDWLFAVARETLCESLRAGHVPDRARRKTGTGDCEMTDAGARWVREVAAQERLDDLVAELPTAMRDAVLAPVPKRDAAALAARLSARRRTTPEPGSSRQRRLAPRLGRFGLAR